VNGSARAKRGDPIGSRQAFSGRHSSAVAAIAAVRTPSISFFCSLPSGSPAPGPRQIATGRCPAVDSAMRRGGKVTQWAAASKPRALQAKR
jgi:hypothetical protein